MKKSSLLILTFLLISCKTISPSDEKEKKLINDANYIANSLKSLIKNNSQNKSKVIEIVDAIYEKMDNKELFINIDVDRPENIYEAGSFDVPEDEKQTPKISINPYLINLFKQQPSIVYSILIHEFTHAYCYFKNKDEFIWAHKNDLELYLYEMDASYIEALFIKDFLIPQKYKLTKYEKYLLESLDSDNLSSFSLALRTTDRKLTYELYTISRNEQKLSDKVEAIEKIGDRLLSGAALSEKKGEWDLYCSYMSLKTFIKYVPEILLRITHNDFVKRNQKGYFKISNYPKIEKMRNDMITLIEPYSNSTLIYYKKLYNAFKEI